MARNAKLEHVIAAFWVYHGRPQFDAYEKRHGSFYNAPCNLETFKVMAHERMWYAYREAGNDMHGVNNEIDRLLKKLDNADGSSRSS